MDEEHAETIPAEETEQAVGSSGMRRMAPDWFLDVCWTLLVVFLAAQFVFAAMVL